MQLGDWRLDTVSGGGLRLDGGAMFGVVPKVLWQRYQPADEQNRIRCATNCVLARDGRRMVLIDAGYGGKCSERERAAFALEAGEPLTDNLQKLGVSPQEIDIVVFSHLHFDHAGGGVRRVGEELVPTFPNATYVAQRGEWDDAFSGRPELKGAYPLENLEPLLAAGQVRWIEGDVEIVPGITTRVTGGHTRSHQAILIDGGGRRAAYLGDLCPMTSHMPSLWGMGYDAYPLDTRRQKPAILAEAAAGNWWVLWDHDPDWVASRIVPDAKRDYAPMVSSASLSECTQETPLTD